MFASAMYLLACIKTTHVLATIIICSCPFALVAINLLSPSSLGSPNIKCVCSLRFKASGAPICYCFSAATVFAASCCRRNFLSATIMQQSLLQCREINETTDVAGSAKIRNFPFKRLSIATNSIQFLYDRSTWLYTGPLPNAFD